MKRAQGFGSATHLVWRFFTSLVPIGPTRRNENWALGQLNDSEQRLFKHMSGPDRRHAIAVAHRASKLAAGRGLEPRDEVVAAALLHDVGKVEAGLGTVMRAVTTLAALVLGRARVLSLESRPGWRGRAAAYLAHDRLGANLLEQAGSQALTRTWAREHHLPSERWTVDRETAICLKEADGD